MCADPDFKDRFKATEAHPMARILFGKLPAVAFLIAVLLAGCGWPQTTGTAPAAIPVFKDASVHDPSIVKVDDTFYAFGSHLAAAKTKDFMQWDLIASDVNNANRLIKNVKEELEETFAWAQTNTLWAADVIQLKDGRFYMYYNACKGDSPRSAMGVAVADDVEGPYKDQGIILKSGMWGQPSEDGTIYDATKHPNVVDPDVFYDNEGKLWMLYGSYSGGLFILEMDEATGKPLPGQGYGKKLIGGNHSRIEGGYILYHPDTKFYYMFLSFGGLDASGGYNIRVARSERPDGPYYDAEGNDMIDVKA
ncbi:MAG TPA: family 43 glycosylhydrolase, partial [Herpetosiphonaceae bacterium]|nr:family 43 glycosylhydrolase [Herpetosiphonaceae bacterium]